MSSNLYNKVTLKGQGKQDLIAPKMYKGFSTINTTTENFSLFDIELVKQDLLNHFHVRQGERLMNPEFGTIIWDLLKDLITTNVNQIVNYDPRIRAENVVVTSYDNGIQIECMLTFLPHNISQSLQLRFDQANGLLAQ